MKKHRALALTLSLTLTLSLSAPALAAEGQFTVNGEPVLTVPAGTDPADYFTVDVRDLADTGISPDSESYGDFLERFYAEYAQSHPEEYAAFDPHAWWREDWGAYWDSEEEFIGHMVREGYWDSAEDFPWEMWESYLGPKADEAWYAKEVEDYRAAHPGELEALTLDQLLAWQGYTEPLTPVRQCVEDWGLDSEADVMPTLLRDYVSDRISMAETHALALEYQAAYPEQWAQFDADAYYSGGDYWGEDKAEHMAAYHLFTEEEFIEQMFVLYVEMNAWEWDNEEDGWYDLWYDDEEERPLTLVVNGQRVEGADIFAENGVSYASAAVFNAVMGTNYADAGSMVSIRQAAEDAGWDVGWNAYSNTVFLLDREGLKAQYAESAAALDALMDWALEHTDIEPGQSYRTTETCDVTLTLLDSLDGDEDYTLRFKLDALQRDTVVELKATLNAAGLLSLLGEDLVSALTTEAPQLTLWGLQTLLAGVECNAILDLEKGDFYFNLPILAALDRTMDEDTWYALSAGMGVDEALSAETGMTLADLLRDLPGVLSEMIYQSLLESSAGRWNTPEDAFGETETAVDFLSTFVGPDTLERSGTTLTWSVDTGTVNAMLSRLLGVDAAPFRTYELTYMMKGDGSFTCDVEARPDMKGLAAAMYSEDSYDSSDLWRVLSGRMMSLLDFRVEGHSAGTADRAEGSIEYHQKNAFELRADMDSVRKEVRDIPAAQPPEGAKIVTL